MDIMSQSGQSGIMDLNEIRHRDRLKTGGTQRIPFITVLFSHWINYQASNRKKKTKRGRPAGRLHKAVVNKSGVSNKSD